MAMPPATPPPPAPPTPGADPSMDEILASIRKILNEDEAKAAPEPAPPTLPLAAPSALVQEAPHPAAGVLVLDETMLVPSAPEAPPPAPTPMPTPAPSREPSFAGLPPMQVAPPLPVALPSLPVPSPGSPALVVDPPAPARTPLAAPGPAPESPPLVGDAAAGAAGASVAALLRTLSRERATATHRGGPTIEDLVREEMRPLLKEWLDLHLPPLVERLVRAEIERLVNRPGP